LKSFGGLGQAQLRKEVVAQTTRFDLPAPEEREVEENPNVWLACGGQAGKLANPHLVVSIFQNF
jgi:hypothetical protein